MSKLEEGIAALLALADKISTKAPLAEANARAQNYLLANKILNALIEENRAAEELVRQTSKPKWRFQELYRQLDTVRTTIKQLMATFPAKIEANRLALAALTATAQTAPLSAGFEATALPPFASGRPPVVSAWDASSQPATSAPDVGEPQGAPVASPKHTETEPPAEMNTAPLPGSVPTDATEAAIDPLTALELPTAAAIFDKLRQRRTNTPRATSLSKAAANQHSGAVSARPSNPIETHVAGTGATVTDAATELTAPPVEKPVEEMHQQPMALGSSAQVVVEHPGTPETAADITGAVEPAAGSGAVTAPLVSSAHTEGARPRTPGAPVDETITAVNDELAAAPGHIQVAVSSDDAPLVSPEAADAGQHLTATPPVSSSTPPSSDDSSVQEDTREAPTKEPLGAIVSLDSSAHTEGARPRTHEVAVEETATAVTALTAAALGDPTAADARQALTATPPVSGSAPLSSDDSSVTANPSGTLTSKPAHSEERQRYDHAYLACHQLLRRIPADTSDANKSKQLSNITRYLNRLLAQVNYVGSDATDSTILNTLTGVLEDTCARMEGREDMDHRAYKARANAMQGHTNTKLQLIGGAMLLLGAALFAAGFVCPPLIGAGIAAAAVCGVLSAGFFYTGRKQGLSGAASTLNNAWEKAGNPNLLPAEEPKTAIPGI